MKFRIFKEDSREQKLYGQVCYMCGVLGSILLHV